MTVLPYPDPIVKDYQTAFVAYFGGEPPKVRRRTAKGYVIQGIRGESRLLTPDHMKRLTRAMLLWCRDARRGA